MRPEFRAFVEELDPKFKALVAMPPVTSKSLPRELPKRAIYLFSEGDTHMYVGRTNRLRGRLRDHWSPSAKHNKATFAFLMAREETNRVRPTYTKAGSRESLEKDVDFARAFEGAKSRIAGMHLRFIEVEKPVAQALLEIYAATVLPTKYNDFENH